MAIITLAQVKTQLGLSDSTYDAAITAKLPIIDAKVKLITRNNWNQLIYGNTVEDSDYIIIYRDVNWKLNYSVDLYDYVMDMVQISMQISGSGIPSGAYVADVYPDGTADSDYYPQIQISANATESANGVKMFLGFPTAYHDIVAKGIWYLISMTSTTLPSNSVASKRMGPVSISYSDSDSKIDGVSGMPMWFVKGLPRYHGGL